MILSEVLLLAVVSGFLLDSVQSVPCSPSTPRNETCCEDGDRCPLGRYQVASHNQTCEQLVLTTEFPESTTEFPESTTEFPESTTGASTNFSTESNDTAQPISLLCESCAPNCQLCNGNAINDCQQCDTGYTLETTSGTTSCVQKTTTDGGGGGDGDGGGGAPVGLIAGAVGGGVVLLVVVVVLVVCLLRRRRRRRDIEREQGPGMLGPPDLSMDSLDDKDSKGPKEAERKTPKRPKHVDDPTYINVQRTAPRPVSIERGHDNVLRYTRDPTTKGNQRNLGGFQTSLTEKEELEKLGEAPLPPGQAPKRPAPPEDEYMIKEDDVHASPILTRDPKPHSSTLPGQGHDHGKKAKPKHHHRQHPQQLPSRSRTMKDSGGGSADGKYPGGGNRRMTDPHFSPSLPNPSAPASCPELPRFPMEEAAEAEASKKGSRPRRNLNVHAPVQEEPPERSREDEGEESDPENYINVQGKGRLTGGGGGEPKQGLVNPAAELEEPQGTYSNQAAIDELEREGQRGADNRYSNTAQPPLVEPVNYEVMDIAAGRSRPTSADNTAGGQEEKEEEDGVSPESHPYENVPFGISRKS